MTNYDDQRYMSDGLEIKQPLGRPDSSGRTYQVLEVSFGKPALRMARIISRPDNLETWPTRFLERLEPMLKRSLPHVSVLRDVRFDADGTLTILTDAYDQRLCDIITETKGAGLKVARPMIQQMLEGLAELHRHDFIHGSVQPHNFFLTNGGGATNVDIGNVSVATLAEITGNKVRQPESDCYFPSESKGNMLPPSKSADVFAIGLSIVELLLGYEENPNRKKGGFTEESGSKLGRALRAKKIPSDLRRLVGHLLGDVKRRPVDAVAASDLYAELREQDVKKPWRIAVAIVLVMAVAIGIWLFKTNDENKVLLARVGLLETDNKRLQGDNSDLTAKNVKLNQENQELRGKIKDQEKEPANNGTPPKELILQEAKNIWQNKIQEIRRADKKIEDIDLTLPEETREDQKKTITDYLIMWFKASQKRDAKAMRWLTQDDTVQKLLDDAITEPWDTTKGSALESHLKDLDDAESSWRVWAVKEHLDVNDIPVLIAAERPSVATILSRWYAALTRGGNWTFRPERATALPGDGTTRLITVYSPNTWSGPPHAWAVPASAAYPAKPPFVDDVTFSWKPGASIQIYLEGEWRVLQVGASENLVVGAFDGPLALWKAHDAGSITDGAGRSLSFDIVKCAGPPRKPKPPNARPAAAQANPPQTKP